MKPFVRMAVCPVKKKYSTREVLELKVALSSKMLFSKCLEKGSRSSLLFFSSLEVARATLARILGSRLMRKSLSGSSLFSFL